MSSWVKGQGDKKDRYYSLVSDGSEKVSQADQNTCLLYYTPEPAKGNKKAEVGVMKPDGDVYGFAYPHHTDPPPQIVKPQPR